MEKNLQTDTLPTRVSLLRRIKNLDDAESWRDFFGKYEDRVIGIARSRGLSDCDAQEVAQEVFKRVARTICQYRPMARPGSFRSWLYNLTRWRAADQIRERNRMPVFVSWGQSLTDSEGSDRTPTIERMVAPAQREEAFEIESRQHVFETLVKLIEKNISPRHLQIFQMLVMDDAPPTEVAEFYGISVASVYLIKHRVAAKLRRELSHLPLSAE